MNTATQMKGVSPNCGLHDQTVPWNV